MKNMMKLLGAFLVIATFSGQTCTKVLVYGRDYLTDPFKGAFESSKSQVMAAAKTVLATDGYQILSASDESGKFDCGWRPVSSDSHYFNLFGTKDYGVTDGAYYQLLMEVTEGVGGKTNVRINTRVKTVAGRFYSSGVVERKILGQMADQLRSPLLEMTNVDVRKK